MRITLLQSFRTKKLISPPGSMKKILIYVLPALLVPGLFVHILWSARQAEGWGGWGFSAALGQIVIGSGILGIMVCAIAMLSLKKGRPNWPWLLVSAGIIASPVLYFLFRLAIV